MGESIYDPPGDRVDLGPHLLSDVEQICDRVGILVKGKLTIKGRLEELLTRRIQQIEVVATGLTDAAAKAGDLGAAFTRHTEDGDHFIVTDMNDANRLVQSIHAQGGALFAFTPVRESLEDYFMRQQEVPDADSRRRT